jgi:hypothetical protein
MTNSEVIAVCLVLSNLRKFCVLEQIEVDEAVDTAKNDTDKKSKIAIADNAAMIECWEGQSMAYDDVLGRIDSIILETIDTIEDKTSE